VLLQHAADVVPVRRFDANRAQHALERQLDALWASRTTSDQARSLVSTGRIFSRARALMR
jgi:hypothetical protein